MFPEKGIPGQLIKADTLWKRTLVGKVMSEKALQ